MKEEIANKRPQMKKKKVLFHQDNAPCHKSIDPSNYYLFVDFKRMLRGKRFGSNEKVIAETKAYFDAKDESFYKKGIEMSEKRWNGCITL